MLEFVLQKYIKMSQDAWRLADRINDDVGKAIYAERLLLVNQFIYDLRRLQAAQAVIESLDKEGVTP